MCPLSHSGTQSLLPLHQKKPAKVCIYATDARPEAGRAGKGEGQKGPRKSRGREGQACKCTRKATHASDDSVGVGCVPEGLAVCIQNWTPGIVKKGMRTLITCRKFVCFSECSHACLHIGMLVHANCDHVCGHTY